MEPAPTRAKPRFNIPMLRAMRHRNFRWFWFSGVGQTTGQGMMQLTLAWLVLELTGSITQFGLVVFAQGLPMLAFVLFGGVLADRMDRRKLLLVSQVLIAANIIILATLAVAELVEVWHIYLTSFMAGLMGGLTGPARTAYLRSLVEREDVMNAIALNSLLMNTSRIVGPSVAGGLIQWVGIDSALYVNAALYIMGTVALLPIAGVPAMQRLSMQSPARDLVAGLRYAWSTPPILAVCLLALITGMFGMPFIQLIPAFGKEVLSLSAGEVGLLMMAVGGGALTGNIFLASMSDYKHKSKLLVGMLLLFGASMLAFAFTPWYPVLIVLLAVVGLASTATVALITSLVAIISPPELLGRVMSLTLVGASLMFVGSLPMALAGDRFGLPLAFAVWSVILLVLAVLVGVVWSPLRKLSA